MSFCRPVRLGEVKLWFRFIFGYPSGKNKQKREDNKERDREGAKKGERRRMKERKYISRKKKWI